MNNFYCVYLTVYSGNLLPPFYIGSTTTQNIHNGYKGSVSSKKYKKIWKLEINNHPELFKTYILSVHNDRQAAMSKETKFHEHLSVHKNDLYINRSTARGKFFNTGPQTSEHRQKVSHSKKVFYSNIQNRLDQSENRKGKRHSLDTKDKIRNSLKSKYKNGYKNPMTGIKRPSLAKYNEMRKGSHWYNNGSISKRLLDHEIPTGWIKGRLPYQNNKE
jgi:hypothetical protein